MKISSNKDLPDFWGVLLSRVEISAKTEKNRYETEDHFRTRKVIRDQAVSLCGSKLNSEQVN